MITINESLLDIMLAIFPMKNSDKDIVDLVLTFYRSDILKILDGYEYCTFKERYLLDSREKIDSFWNSYEVSIMHILQTHYGNVSILDFCHCDDETDYYSQLFESFDLTEYKRMLSSVAIVFICKYIAGIEKPSDFTCLIGKYKYWA